MKRLFAMVLLVSLLLTGCDSIFDGSYVSVTPHKNSASVANAHSQMNIK